MSPSDSEVGAVGHSIHLADYASCVTALSSPSARCHPGAYGERPGSYQMTSTAAGDVMSNLLFMDGDQHHRVRRALAAVIGDASDSWWCSAIERHVELAMERCRGRDTVDFVSEVTRPFAVGVICQASGVSDADVESVHDWLRDLVLLVEPGGSEEERRRGNSAGLRSLHFVGRRLRRRESLDPSSLFARLIAAADAGVISHQELVTTCVVLLHAGYENTANFLAGAVLSLLRHPTELARLTSGELTMAAAVDELLRHVSPAQLTVRAAADDLLIGGTEVPKGAAMLIALGDANRDDTVFDEPEDLRLTRPRPRHLTFGFGPHFCLGAAIARVEAAAFLERFFAEFPRCALVSATQEHGGLTRSYASVVVAPDGGRS